MGAKIPHLADALPINKFTNALRIIIPKISTISF